MSLKVNEIFYSIQGESSYAGRPCAFIRLTGCNLRCTYCDTVYAYNEGHDLEIDEIIQEIESYHCSLIEITGGEPLIQPETPKLIRLLLDKRYTVLLETNGSQRINIVDDKCIKIMDIKCPSSGEQNNNDLYNIELLSEKDEIKFVIGDLEDYEYATRVLNTFNEVLQRKITVNFSPVFGKIEPKKLANWLLNDHFNARLQIQLHKIIWDPNERGV